MNIRFVPFSQWDRDVKTKFYTLVIAAVMVVALLTGLSMCAPAAKSKGGTPQVAATTHTPTPTAKPLAAGLEIGRASCRERVESWGGGGWMKKKEEDNGSGG